MLQGLRLIRFNEAAHLPLHRMSSERSLVFPFPSCTLQTTTANITKVCFNKTITLNFKQKDNPATPNMKKVTTEEVKS